MTKYAIHTGYPTRPLQEAVDAGSSLQYGFARTLERAIERATKLTKETRSDLPVGVVVDGKVVAESTTDTGPGGVFTRPVLVMED